MLLDGHGRGQGHGVGPLLPFFLPTALHARGGGLGERAAAQALVPASLKWNRHPRVTLWVPTVTVSPRRRARRGELENYILDRSSDGRGSNHLPRPDGDFSFLPATQPPCLPTWTREGPLSVFSRSCQWYLLGSEYISTSRGKKQSRSKV